MRERLNEYQENYCEHVLRMPTDRIPRQLLSIRKKQRRNADIEGMARDENGPEGPILVDQVKSKVAALCTTY